MFVSALCSLAHMTEGKCSLAGGLSFHITGTPGGGARGTIYSPNPFPPSPLLMIIMNDLCTAALCVCDNEKTMCIWVCVLQRVSESPMHRLCVCVLVAAHLLTSRCPWFLLYSGKTRFFFFW